ncbi:Acg family FMN-binding oxidoreductase [Saccharopolyspora mangrovi]|uniref:Nitroreductase family protein n=1 Tax=Saccharopolyspora mangrovi TaxID=3082379 RepID=A0ABU6AF13_9PSEU|nr:nitroreductase family protein [Saccharopolyspora sp. S2-29]MEB3369989.1 nitroreductase family protein [Saccharopolyspora sp. S2-29]
MNSFPTALGLSAEQTEHAIRCAGRAPSLHNRQPWRFRLAEHVIEVHADPQRRLPATDPDDRELRLACGAALLNLRLALQHAGVRPVVDPPSRMGPPTVLAEVRSGGWSAQTPVERALYEAIPRRRTNRRPFQETPVPSGDRHALVSAAQREQGWLHLLPRSELDRFAEMVQRAHRVQMEDERFRAEFERWTGRSRETREGVPAAASGPQPEPQDLWVVRDFSSGTASERVAGKDFEREPLLAVLCSQHDGRADDVLAGQAMQRVLLTACVHGLSASLLSQVVEVPETREELRSLLGGSQHPQAVLRFGYGSPTPETPRREPTDLLLD